MKLGINQLPAPKSVARTRQEAVVTPGHCGLSPCSLSPVTSGTPSSVASARLCASLLDGRTVRGTAVRSRGPGMWGCGAAGSEPGQGAAERTAPDAAAAGQTEPPTAQTRADPGRGLHRAAWTHGRVPALTPCGALGRALCGRMKLHGERLPSTCKACCARCLRLGLRCHGGVWAPCHAGAMPRIMERSPWGGGGSYIFLSGSFCRELL